MVRGSLSTRGPSSKRWRSKLIRRSSLLAVSLLLLGACVSSVGGLSAQWRQGRPPIVTAPDGPCPALEGTYWSDGHERTAAAGPAVLQHVLGHDLGLTELLPTNGPPDTTTAFSREGDEWRVWDLHGEVRLAINGEPSSLDRNWSAHGSRVAGCAGGRLWIGLSSVRTQYESMTQTRALGVLSPGPDGSLLIEVRTERRHYGLLPWPSVQRRSARYSFATATAPRAVS